jgi:hypothetical protein
LHRSLDRSLRQFPVRTGEKHNAAVPVSLELQEGRTMVQQAAERSDGQLSEQLPRCTMNCPGCSKPSRWRCFCTAQCELMAQADHRAYLSLSAEFPVDVERELAQFASWYELFPRSITDDPARHGTFNDVHARLPMIQDMGFDVLYFPPIHPIGRAHRKGRNNSLTAGPDDPGSPYAIGSEEGGHEAIHSQLGTREDFRRLVVAAPSMVGNRPRLRHPVLPGSPVAQAASGLVQLAPGRHDQIRGEPAEEIPGHRQRRLLCAGRDSQLVGRAARHWSAGSRRA